MLVMRRSWGQGMQVTVDAKPGRARAELANGGPRSPHMHTTAHLQSFLTRALVITIIAATLMVNLQFGATPQTFHCHGNSAVLCVSRRHNVQCCQRAHVTA